MNETSPPIQKEGRTGAPKILFIEGHSMLREVWAQLLDLAGGYEIDVARNGLEGVQKASTWPPDLILMGLRLPLLDGYETIRAIRSNPITIHTPIIVISAWSSATHKQQALALGANEHITPPVDIDRLLSRIDSYLK
jgi:two-component system cell cycle response regulator DivK